MGPALSCFDVDLSAAFQPGAAPKSSSEAKRVAQQQATAQEARSMLGVSTPTPYTLQCLLEVESSCIMTHRGANTVPWWALQQALAEQTLPSFPDRYPAL